MSPGDRRAGAQTGTRTGVQTGVRVGGIQEACSSAEMFQSQEAADGTTSAPSSIPPAGQDPSPSLRETTNLTATIGCLDIARKDMKTAKESMNQTSWELNQATKHPQTTLLTYPIRILSIP